MKYVDGYIIPIQKTKLKKYLRDAKIAEKVWRRFGALDYKESVADDLFTKWGTSFSKLTKLKKDETLVFAFIVFKSKTHRNSVNKKAMKEVEKLCNESNAPFDIKRMSYAGFKLFVGR